MLRFVTRQLPITALAACALGLGMAQTANAGPLTDWLFGQYRQPPAYPVGPSYYIAPGMNPQANAVPYTTNYSGYTPYLPSTLPMGTNGYAASGPLVSGPLVSGTTNQPAYATPYASQYAPSYTTQYAPQYTTPYSNSPVTQYTTQYAPQYSSAPAPNYQGPSMLGGVTPSIVNTPIQTTGPYPVTGINQLQPAFLPNAGYATQYNRAAVTYYRPVTQLDPTTGTTVTRMMPCTSYELQAQRQPILTMRPALFGNYPSYRWPSLAAPVTGNSPSYYTAPAYNTSPVPSNTIPTTVQMMPTAGTGMVVPGQYYSGYSSAPLPTTYSAAPTATNAFYNAYPTTVDQVVPAGGYTHPSYAPPAPTTFSQPTSTSVMPTPPSTEGEWRRVDDGSILNPNGNGLTQPGYQNPPAGQRSIADPESTVTPSLQKQSSAPAMPSVPSTNPQFNPALPSGQGPTSLAVTRENQNAEPKFGLKPLESSRIAEETSLPIGPSSPNNSLLTVPSTLPPEPKTSTATGFESIQPIQGPSTAPAPRWNQGLMDVRDRTASQSGSATPVKAEATSDPAIRWISTERDRNQNANSTRLLQQPGPRIRPSTAK